MAGHRPERSDDMAGPTPPGPLGSDPLSTDLPQARVGFPPGAGFHQPGPAGGDPIPLAEGDRIVTAVTKDWVPPTPKTTPEIIVRGDTLEAVANELNALPEWGRGGGFLRTDRVPVGTSPTVTVAIRANLIKVLPRWTKFDKASVAVRAEWNRMLAKLTIHEQRHMEIAIEEAENLATSLKGVEIGEIADLVTAANQTMQTRQDELDTDTDHGAKTGVPFGDVFLDISIV